MAAAKQNIFASGDSSSDTIVFALLGHGGAEATLELSREMMPDWLTETIMALFG